MCQLAQMPLQHTAHWHMFPANIHHRALEPRELCKWRWQRKHTEAYVQVQTAVYSVCVHFHTCMLQGTRAWGAVQVALAGQAHSGIRKVRLRAHPATAGARHGRLP